MHGIITLLPQPFYAEVEALWNELEQSAGLRGIRVTPFPHFSWQIGSHYPEEPLAQALKRLAAETEPIPARAGGLGFFTGASPVMYIPVVKTRRLAEFHRRVWEALLPLGEGISPYYAPESWMPHISLAYGDLTPDNIGAAVGGLINRPLQWDFTIDNLAYGYEPEGETAVVKMQFALGRT